MRIQNIRLGHACNSSSTHSLIFLDKAPRDDYAGATPGQYGWERFTLSSPEAKGFYVATQLYQRLDAILDDPAVSLAIVRELVGSLPHGATNYDGDPWYYVDHQSAWTFPRDFGKTLPSFEFTRDLIEYMGQDGLVILGGNDNGGDHPLSPDPWHDDKSFALPFADSWAGLVARKDSGLWVLFNQVTGAKIRLDMSDPRMEASLGPEYKPETPELVDVKITDFCPFNCAFCYQGSTAQGQHAEDLYLVRMALEELKVFEVAIGGGEPTLHPGFAGFIRQLRHADIVPNFTTRNMAWLRGKDARQILDDIGAFAFSVDRADQVDQLHTELAYHGKAYTGKATLQVIEGVTDRFALTQVLSQAKHHNMPVTILGYKETGRGAEFDKKKEYDWLEVVLEFKEKYGLPRLAIDTVLAERDAERLVEAGIDRRMFSVKEGQHSMYIDAVEQRIGPSSYCEEDEYVEYRYNLDQLIRQEFARW